MALTVDDFLLTLGKPGRFQIIACLLLWSNTYPIAFNNFVTIFYGVIPKHHCKSTHLMPVNYTSQSCSVMDDLLNKTVPCTNGWDYDPKLGRRSIVSEWDLVCDNKWQLSLGFSIYFVGVMVGGLSGGFLADKIGRQPIILMGIYTQAILGLSVAFIKNYWVFVAVRFFHAIVLQLCQCCSYILMMEMLQPKMRDKAAIFASLSWTTGIALIAIICWFLDDWRHVQLAMTIPSVISFFYFSFIPESMRWLITQQKVDKAETLARKMAKFNNIELSADVRAQIEQLCLDCAVRAQNSLDRNYTLLDLVRTPKIRKYTMVVAFVWFTASTVTYGISFGLTALASNVYLTIVISNSIQACLCGVSFLMLRKFGRKRPVVMTIGLSGMFCVAIPLIFYFGGDTSTTTTASTVCAVIAKIFMSFTWTIIALYTIELYPTVIRSFGQGSAGFCTRIGGILSPQIALLGNVLWKPAPFLIIGMFGITSSLLILLLPDTHKKPMPDMIEDVEGTMILKAKPEKNQTTITTNTEQNKNGNVNQAFELEEKFKFKNDL